uniref:Uncharacterized protein n=1 Tax=Oryza rufipogon TaxID=4529 RepID=A0A0E0R6J6_ORYRU
MEETKQYMDGVQGITSHGREDEATKLQQRRRWHQWLGLPKWMARGRLWFHDGSSASACRRRRPNMKEQRGSPPMMAFSWWLFGNRTTMTCFVICKWNHDHVHAQDDKLGRKKMMKEVDVGQPSSLGLRRWHRLEVPSSRTMAYKRSGRASMLQHGVAEAAAAATAARHGWGSGVVVKQRGKEEGCCSY